MKNRAHNDLKIATSRLSFLLLLTISAAHLKAVAVDYNGNPINNSGGITINPKTSSAILASYTQAINLAGLLDNTFGTLGVVGTIGAGGGNGSANAGALQPDGKIIATGTTNTAGGGNFEIIRYNQNGAIDLTFNNGLPLVGPAETAYSCLLQPDGKIVAVGTTNLLGGGNFALIRYNSNGTPDTSFNGGAVLVGPDGGGTGLLQPDGKIVAVGTTDLLGRGNFALIRYNSNGTPDTSFNGGTVLVGPAGGAYSCLLQPDGKIVAVGATNLLGGVKFALIRYNSNGSIDTSFNNGTVKIGPAGVVKAALLQPDGKIIAAGGPIGDPAPALLARYNTDGSVDATFGHLGAQGVVTAPTITDPFQAALLQPDGKIIGLGTLNAVTYDFVLARYINPFTLASFTASYGNVGMI